MMALPTPEPSSAWCVMMLLRADGQPMNAETKNSTDRPLSPKISYMPSCTRSAKPGYFCRAHQLPAPPNQTNKAETYIVQRAIRADAASLVEVAHAADDGRDAARRETRGAPPDELGERAEELALGECRLNPEEVREDADDHEQLVRWVAVACEWVSGERRGRGEGEGTSP